MRRVVPEVVKLRRVGLRGRRAPPSRGCDRRRASTGRRSTCSPAYAADRAARARRSTRRARRACETSGRHRPGQERPQRLALHALALGQAGGLEQRLRRCRRARPAPRETTPSRTRPGQREDHRHPHQPLVEARALVDQAVVAEHLAMVAHEERRSCRAAARSRRAPPSARPPCRRSARSSRDRRPAPACRRRSRAACRGSRPPAARPAARRAASPDRRAADRPPPAPAGPPRRAASGAARSDGATDRRRHLRPVEPREIVGRRVERRVRVEEVDRQEPWPPGVLPHEALRPVARPRRLVVLGRHSRPDACAADRRSPSRRRPLLRQPVVVVVPLRPSPGSGWWLQ